MDEFLQFRPEVLESLREPIECGYVDIARHGSRERFRRSFSWSGRLTSVRVENSIPPPVRDANVFFHSFVATVSSSG